MTNEQAIQELNHIYMMLSEDMKKALDVLMAQADGDLISRQAVIDAIDKWVKNMGVLIALPVNEVTPLFDSIHELPSVKPQEPKWIPVSERLPEKPTGRDWYWSSDQRKDIAADEYLVTIKGAKSPTTLHWTGEEWMDIYDNEIYKIVAWMPLPEPYKGEQPKIIKCPNCGNIQFADKEWCPDCGARMVDEQESDHTCHTCKHYTSGERDGSCGSYICKGYSNWESEG